MTDFPEIDVYRSDLERMIVSIFNAEPVLAHPPRPGARPAPVRLHALRSFRVNAVAAPRSRALKRPPPLSDSTRAVGVAARATDVGRGLALPHRDRHGDLRWQ